MIDQEPVAAADLVGARLTRVTAALQDRQSATAPQLSHLWLHLEDLGPVLVRSPGTGLSFRAADVTGVPAGAGTTTDPADLPLTRFLGRPIRSVSTIEYREGGTATTTGTALPSGTALPTGTAFTAGLALGFEGGRVRLLGLDGALLVVGPEEHLGGVEARLHEDTALARVVWTCSSSPSQWNAWTTGGRYLYFRYRHGEGSVEHFPGGPDPDTWDEEGSGLLARWHDGSRGGAIDLVDFLVLASLRLAPNSEVLDGR
ncbi:hypothetical protein [Kitasatospora sp. MBT66]|uniref:hypothetical protein n=1 Tax=Kitasatospora sp. MBT66 TaxID=1444769 RepID=UPI0009E6F273|nr:hypothetical protein [Kitasatospora sp. MBT66]